MSGKKYPRLAVREVQAILEARRFVLLRSSGSHEQWGGIIGGRKRLVTVDLHGDYGVDIIQSMIRQSGLTREQFYCSTEKTARCINKELDPDLGE